MKDFQQLASPGKVLIEEIKKGEILNEEKEEIHKHHENIKDGVEIVDVKAIAKKKKTDIDKFGIPTPNNRKTWDKM